MKAGILTGIGELEIGSAPDPHPGPRDVLVAVRAAGLCSSDARLYARGAVGDFAIRKYPFIPGHEVAGEVLAAGPQVRGLSVGDRVAIDPSQPCGKCESCLAGSYNLCNDTRFIGRPPVNGAFCEFLAVPDLCAHRLPPELSLDDGALLGLLAVALLGVDLAAVRPGQTAVVLGAGPLGLMAIQAARAAGAGPVYLAEPLEPRRKLALRLGAAAAYDPAGQDVAAAVLNATNGRGVDVLFEAAGAADAMAGVADMIRPGGTIVSMGTFPEKMVPLPLPALRSKGAVLRFVQRACHTYPRAIQLARYGKVNVRALITHRCSFDTLADTMRLLAGGQEDVVKAVLDPAEMPGR